MPIKNRKKIQPGDMFGRLTVISGADTIFTMMHANLYGSPIADFVGNLLIRFPQQLQDFGPADGTPTGIYD